jgi:hypothetical protein
LFFIGRFSLAMSLEIFDGDNRHLPVQGRVCQPVSDSLVRRMPLFAENDRRRIPVHILNHEIPFAEFIYVEWHVLLHVVQTATLQKQHW